MPLSKASNRPIAIRELHLPVPVGKLLFNILNFDKEAPRPGWSYPAHSHSGWEVHFVPSGQGTLNAAGKQYPILPGTMYLTGPGLIHAQTADLDQPMTEYCIHFELQGDIHTRQRQETWIDEECAELRQVLEQSVFWLGADDGSLIPLFENIYHEYRVNLIGNYVIIQSTLAIIIASILRKLAKNPTAGYQIPLKQQFEARRLVVDDFFRRYREPLIIDDLAKAISLSPRHVQRVLLAYYGKGFTEYLLECRLLAACELLADGKLAMQQIAKACGFGTADWFRRCFKNRFNLNPSAWKKR